METFLAGYFYNEIARCIYTLLVIDRVHSLFHAEHKIVKLWLQAHQVRVSHLNHCQKFGTRWRLRPRTKVIMAAKSYKEMYGNKETFSNISIMSLRVFGARLETC